MNSQKTGILKIFKMAQKVSLGVFLEVFFIWSQSEENWKLALPPVEILYAILGIFGTLAAILTDF